VQSENNYLYKKSIPINLHSMKTKHLIIFIATAILTISFSRTANSQVLISLLFGEKLNTEKLKFGLDGGVNFSNITNIDPSQYKAHFNLGFYFDLMLKEKTRWYLHTGVLVKSAMGPQGLDTYTIVTADSNENANLNSLFAGGTLERKLSYFNVPILIRYKFKNELFIEAGPSLGLLYKAYDIFYADVKDKEDLTYELEVRDDYHRIDAGVMAGIGYNVIKGTGYNFGLRYYYGLTGLMKDNSGDPQRNSSIYLFASLPVGAGEKAKAKAAAKKLEKEEKNARKEQKGN
jgi:hypothetical protein